LILFFLSVLGFSVIAGTNEELQYRMPPFKSIDIHTDIQYGRNVTVNGDTVNLYLDCYRPANDTLDNRPLIIMLHSGGFVGGEKEDPKNVKICQALASYGYVSASVGYRTGIPKKRRRYFIDAILRAIEDTYDAIMFLKSRCDYFGIDTGKVFLGGISAGAVVALHYAYWDPDDEMRHFDSTHALYYVLKKKNEDGLSSIKGIINCWGSLFTLSFMKNNNIPVLSFHGTRDRMAPYKKGHPLFIPWLPRVYGSYSVHQYAMHKQNFSVLKTYKGMRHGHNEQSPYLDTTLAIMHNYINCLSMESQDYKTLFWRFHNTDEGSLVQPELWNVPISVSPEIVFQESGKMIKSSKGITSQEEKTATFQ